MTVDKKSVDFFRQALGAINMVEEPIAYKDYIEKKNNPVEDSEYDADMAPEKDHDDHEVNMAKSDMFKAMGYAKDIYTMLE